MRKEQTCFGATAALQPHAVVYPLLFRYAANHIFRMAVYSRYNSGRNVAA